MLIFFEHFVLIAKQYSNKSARRTHIFCITKLTKTHNYANIIQLSKPYGCKTKTPMLLDKTVEAGTLTHDRAPERAAVVDTDKEARDFVFPMLGDQQLTIPGASWKALSREDSNLTLTAVARRVAFGAEKLSQEDQDRLKAVGAVVTALEAQYKARPVTSGHIPRPRRPINA